MLIMIGILVIILLILSFQYYYLKNAYQKVQAELERAIEKHDQILLAVDHAANLKEQQERIAQLTYRDSLTGLYNRVYFNEKLPSLDNSKEWPLSVIFADLNGLKLTNDIFGHSVGDELLLEVSKVFREVCRPEDRIFRWGGDEFVVFLPRTDAVQADEVRTRLHKALAGRVVGSMRLSVPLGLSTKEGPHQDIEIVLQQAEEEMYWMKTTGRSNYQKETLQLILQVLHAKSEAEKNHAERVQALAIKFGKHLELAPHEIHTLQYAGFLHDIGKIAVDSELLHKPYPLAPAEEHEMQRHPLVGFRLLNFFEDTMDLASSVLAHHEHWDGNGYPKGLQGEDIPLFGRILALLETYDRILHAPTENVFGEQQALDMIVEASGTKFDPRLVTAFVDMIRGSKKDHIAQL